MGKKKDSINTNQPLRRLSIHEIDENGCVKIEIWSNTRQFASSYVLDIDDINNVINHLEIQKRMYEMKKCVKQTVD